MTSIYKHFIKTYYLPFGFSLLKPVGCDWDHCRNGELCTLAAAEGLGLRATAVAILIPNVSLPRRYRGWSLPLHCREGVGSGGAKICR